jgi:hypothetical protein
MNCMRVADTAQLRQNTDSQHRQHDGHVLSQQLPALKQQQFMYPWQHEYSFMPCPPRCSSTRLRVRHAAMHGHTHEARQQHGVLQHALHSVV